MDDHTSVWPWTLWTGAVSKKAVVGVTPLGHDRIAAIAADESSVAIMQWNMSATCTLTMQASVNLAGCSIPWSCSSFRAARFDST